MFDAKLRPLIDPPLKYMGGKIAKRGITANQITLIGMGLGIVAAIAIGFQHYLIGLIFILLSRLCDGLDGAVARASHKTDFGGYLDIVSDFVFYVAVPIGFSFANGINMVWAMLLIASFTLTGISFLAFATVAEKRALKTEAHGVKSFFYNTGLAEGAETIAVFVLMCILPAYFPLLAGIYTVLCLITVIQRSLYARQLFRD